MWNGTFSPALEKHRLYTGNIGNHIEISKPVIDWTLRVVTVTVTFIASAGESYDFELPLEYFDEEDEEGNLKLDEHAVGRAMVLLWQATGGNLSAGLPRMGP